MKMQRKPLINIGAAGMIAASLAMTACKQEALESGGEAAALEERLQAVEAERQELEGELAELKREADKKRLEIEAVKKSQQESIVEMQRKLREAKKEAESLKAEFDAYREEYKVSIRTKAKGIQLGNLTLSSGPTYADVVVSKWTPGALRVTHSGGTKALPFSELPENVQEMFVYDEEETKELLAKGDEAATTGKPPARRTEVAQSWPTKDPNGSSGPLVFTEPENTGIVYTEKMTALERQIQKYDIEIRKVEMQINRYDQQIHEAIARGSGGGQRSAEKKAERLMTKAEKLRSERAKLIAKLPRNR